MSGQEIAFYIFSTLAVAFSILVVTNKNPIHSAFSLVLVFFCIAADFVLLNAHLLATLQILVYAGAVMVLFLFVIMLLNADVKNNEKRKIPKFKVFVTLLLCCALFLIINYAIQTGHYFENKEKFTEDFIESMGGNTKVISTLMFSDFILPFELTSILLLVGIVGSVALAKRKLDLEEKSK
jgi:NADH-quinone oxidoreductase subunit J